MDHGQLLSPSGDPMEANFTYSILSLLLSGANGATVTCLIMTTSMMRNSDRAVPTMLTMLMSGCSCICCHVCLNIVLFIFFLLKEFQFHSNSTTAIEISPLPLLEGPPICEGS